MRRAIWLTALLASVGCDAQRTHIALNVPPSARGRITEVWVASFRQGETATLCDSLKAWAVTSCGLDCASVEGSRPDPGDPAHEARFTPDAEGRFGAPELPIDEGTRWDVMVVAQVEGAEPLYGCGPVAAGDDVELSLFWPWCSPRACEVRFRPECFAEIRCLPTADNPLTPECTSLVSTVSVWEQDGEACAAPAGGPCRPAIYDCEDGSLTPIEDGICPQARDEHCIDPDGMYEPERDLDCNLSHPLCMRGEACDPSIREPCGTVGECSGAQICVDGELTECLFQIEECNGADDDCDGDTDETSAVADDCNAGRAPAAPAADQCTAASCSCVGGPACGPSEVCCRAGCVDLSTSPSNCGVCGRVCGDDERCVLGTCRGVDAADAGVADAGPPPECESRDDCNRVYPRADTCDADGQCRCGAAAPCVLPSICCDGMCVNGATDPMNCGGCGVSCDTGTCDRGRCR